jgi:hypothetical protein
MLVRIPETTTFLFTRLVILADNSNHAGHYGMLGAESQLAALFTSISKSPKSLLFLEQMARGCAGQLKVGRGPSGLRLAGAGPVPTHVSVAGAANPKLRLR